MRAGTAVKYRVRSLDIRPLYLHKSKPVPGTSVSSVRHHDRYRVLRRFGVTSIPVPDISICSVRYPYRYRILRQLRCDIDTGAVGTRSDLHTGIGHFGEFGTTSIPVPDTSGYGYRFRLYRYRLPYRYRVLRQVRYSINTGTGHFGKFNTTFIPVPGVPVPYGTRPWNLVHNARSILKRIFSASTGFPVSCSRRCPALYEMSTPKTMLWISRGADDVKIRPSLCIGIVFIGLMYLPFLMQTKADFNLDLLLCKTSVPQASNTSPNSC